MIEYEVLYETFQNSGYSPAEVHALVAAYVCIGGPIETLIKLFTDKTDDDSPLIYQQVGELYEQINTALIDDSMSFDLVLVPEDFALSFKTDALAKWCKAFLLGFTLNEVKQSLRLSDDSKEALEFFKRITEVELSNDTVSDEDERDFFELEEYVRVAVIMIYTEMQMGSMEQSNQKLH